LGRVDLQTSSSHFHNVWADWSPRNQTSTSNSDSRRSISNHSSRAIL